MTAGVVLLIFGLLPLQAQHEAHGGKPGKSRKAEPQAPAPKSAHEKSPQRQPAQRSGKPPVRREKAPGPSRESRDWQRNKGWQKGGGWKGAKTWKGSRARHWDSEHRTWAQRGGYGGYRMPPARYNRYFGPGHYFRMRGRPVLYGGYPRFHYGGTTFLIVDPWPEYWPERWYDDDDVYVAWDDGYYLYSRRNPGVGISISINL